MKLPWSKYYKPPIEDCSIFSQVLAWWQATTWANGDPDHCHCIASLSPKLLSRLAFSYSYTCVALYLTNFVLFVFVIYCLFVLFCVIHWYYVNMVTRTIRYTVPCLKCILLDTYNKIAVSSYVVGICWIYHWNISKLYDNNEIAAITSWAI